jgi:hypothetical protein
MKKALALLASLSARLALALLASLAVLVRGALRAPAVALLVGLVFAGLGVSCTSKGPLAQPSQSFARASRTTYDELAPRLREYLDGDLELDPAERDLVLGVLGDWDLAIRQAEAFHRRGPDGVEDRGGAR